MTESRDFGRMAQELRQALDQYSREELADLLCHIMRTYVIEAGAPLELDTGPEPGLSELRSLSFAQLVLRLQMSLPQEELRRLEVSGSRVWVRDGQREIPLTQEEPEPEPVPDAEVIDREPPRAEPPRSASPQEAPARPAAPARSAEPDPWEAPGGGWDPPTRDPEPAPAPAPPRVERVQAEPEPWRPAPAVTRQAAPGAIAPRSGDRPVSGRAGISMEDMGQVSRPAAGLRGQADTSPRLPGQEQRPRRRPAWAAEPTVDEVPPPEPVEDDITETSERFSMLELD